MSVVSRFPCSGGGGEAVFDGVREVWHLENVYRYDRNLVVTASGYIYSGISGYQKPSVIHKIDPSGAIVQDVVLGVDGDYGGIALDVSGNIYVADWNGVRMFDTNWVEVWFCEIPMHRITDPSCDALGNCYVQSDTHVAKVSHSGSLLWRSPPDINGYVNALLADSDGNTYCGGGSSWRLVKRNTDGIIIMRVEIEPGGPVRLALDSAGNIYATYSDDRVRKFDSNGKEILQFNPLHHVNNLGAIAVALDASGAVYMSACASDYKTNVNSGHVYRFTPNGTEVWCFTPGCKVVYDIAVDLNGNVYIGGYDDTVRKLSIPAAGKLYLNPNIYDKAGKKPLEVDWVQKTYDPHQLLISCRSGTKKEGI